MKVLVATASTQGVRASDYDWCSEGELVRLGPICTIDERDPDGGCGCGRAFIGLDSHRATTTARVVEVTMTLADYAFAIRSSLRREGWVDSDCRDEAEQFARLVGDWPVGAIVERRLDELRLRWWPGDAGAG